MSTRDLLRAKPAGAVPTAFEVIRNAGRPDWQTVVPSSSEERRWYTVGYAMKDDYEINQPVSPTLPPAFRLWWALGFMPLFIVGFLFTAGRNWSGQPTPQGPALMALAALWVAGRTYWGYCHFARLLDHRRSVFGSRPAIRPERCCCRCRYRRFFH